MIRLLSSKIKQQIAYAVSADNQYFCVDKKRGGLPAVPSSRGKRIQEGNICSLLPSAQWAANSASSFRGPLSNPDTSWVEPGAVLISCRECFAAASSELLLRALAFTAEPRRWPPRCCQADMGTSMRSRRGAGGPVPASAKLRLASLGAEPSAHAASVLIVLLISKFASSGQKWIQPLCGCSACVRRSSSVAVLALSGQMKRK